jgi:hypothetical protein
MPEAFPKPTSAPRPPTSVPSSAVPSSVLPPPPSAAERLLRVALFLLLAAVVAATKTDPDLWGHVRFGADMIHAGAIRLPETYSFTSDRPWINHEWASEVGMGGAYLLAGNVGLFALKFGLIGGMLLLLGAGLRREGVLLRHRDLAMALAVIVTIEQTRTVRPQLFSLFFFAGLFWCLIAAERRAGVLALVPVLFAAWANFHGGWIVGGGVLLVWTAGLLLARPLRGRAIAAHAAAGLAALAATLVNPHGTGLIAFLRDTVGLGRADISEWQPVYAVARDVLALWLFVALLALLGIAQMVRTREWAPSRLLAVVALAVLSFRVNRLLAFFGLATVFLFGRLLAATLARRAAAAQASPRRAAAVVATVVSVLMIAGAVRVLATQASCVAIDPRATPEPGAVRVLQQQGVRGRLLVWFDWGEYALWHLSPRLLVSVDGRRETVYSERVQDGHLRFYFDAPGGATLPDTLRADYVWIPWHLPAASRLAREGWSEIYRGDQSVIFARSPVRTDALPPVGPGRRCFPGP